MQVNRPTTKEASELVEITLWLWLDKKWNRWFKKEVLNKTLLEIWEMNQVNNPWYTHEYMDFRRELSRCPGFYEFWNEIEELRMESIEDELITGRIWDHVKTKVVVDANGNEDIAKGHLSLLDKRVKLMQWILEKRNKKYQFRETIETGKPNIVIMPTKESN